MCPLVALRPVAPLTGRDWSVMTANRSYLSHTNQALPLSIVVLLIATMGCSGDDAKGGPGSGGAINSVAGSTGRGGSASAGANATANGGASAAVGTGGQSALGGS